MEHRTDVSPTNYISVYEQLLEFPSKIDEPELELDLEEFSENWSDFLEEETPRELKEDYPSQLDKDYLKDQHERLEKVLEENLYEYAVVELSSFFEEIFRRVEMQENPFSQEYKDWLLKDCWEWKEASKKVLSEDETEDVEELYNLRNNFLHSEKTARQIRQDSAERLEEVISLYNKISPYEINMDKTVEDDHSKNNFYEKLTKLRKNNLENCIALELFRSLERVENNLDFDLKTEFEEDAEELIHYANEKRWLDDEQFEDVKKAVEYRREISHNIESNENVSKEEINWENVSRFSTKMHIIANVQNISVLDRPISNHSLKADTSLPFNLENRKKLQNFVNSRLTLDQLPKFPKIDWQNLNTSTSTSTW